MIDLNDFYIFAHVVEHKSFTGAAKALGVSRSNVCRRIGHLEKQLQMSLVQRTPRRFEITDIGMEFYGHCLKVIAEAKAAHEHVACVRGTPSGPLHISCAPIAQFLMTPFISQFNLRYPDVRVAMVTDHNVDTDESFDVRVRARHVSAVESGQVVCSLGRIKQVLIASPEFLERHGRPNSPEELARLPTLGHGSMQGPHVWKMFGPDSNALQIRHEPKFIADNMALVHLAALNGMGIAQLPQSVCQSEIRENRLEILLPNFVGSTEIQVLIPSRRGVMLPAVRVFLEFLQGAGLTV